MRLILYARVSSNEQAADGVSLAAQEERMRFWCETYGHQVTVVIQDAGVSGSIPPEDRPGFKEILKALHYKQAEGVVIAALDRVGRSVIDVLTLITDFDKRGWRIFSLRESLDTSTAVGKFTVTILAAVAELERGMISQRTKEGLAQLKAQGKRWNHSIPFGKQLRADDPTMLEDCPIEVEVFQRVADLIRANIRNPQVIADRLNEWHYHPRLKRPWVWLDIKRLLVLMKSRGLKPNVRVIRPDMRRKKPIKVVVIPAEGGS